MEMCVRGKVVMHRHDRLVMGCEIPHLYDIAYPDKNKRKKNPSPPKMRPDFCPLVREFPPNP
jgi:hypothetical protein